MSRVLPGGLWCAHTQVLQLWSEVRGLGFGHFIVLARFEATCTKVGRYLLLPLGCSFAKNSGCGFPKP